MAAKSSENRIEKALRDIELIQAFIAETNFYKRKYERRKTNFKTSVKVLTSKKKDFTEGSAVCLNITPEGMLLSNIKLQGDCIPIDDFIINLSLETGELKGLNATASLVYMTNPKGKTQMGLAFTEISNANKKKISKFLGIEK